MVRLRAVEHGREALMASTVGVSGFVGADGRVTGATGFNTAAVVVRQMHLGDARTLATRLGWWPEVALLAWPSRRSSARRRCRVGVAPGSARYGDGRRRRRDAEER